MLEVMLSDPLPKATALLVDYLRRLQEKGRPRAYLSPEARAGLRQLYVQVREARSGQASPRPVRPRSAMEGGERKPASLASPPTAAKAVSAEALKAPAKAPEAPEVAATAPDTAIRSMPPGKAYPEAPVARARCVLEALGDSREAKLADLQRRLVADAVARPDTLRDTMVFSVGSPEAELMIVGEAPGHEEERQGAPFVGPAGQLLTKIIRAMGLERESVYISNIVKYRPAMPNQGTRNRKPEAAEMQACLPYILAEIDVVQPKVIVAAGATAAEGLTGDSASVGRLRGRVRSWNGIPFVVTYHPSYLLRNEALSERRKVWEDMMLVMELLGLPISEKQRGFFTRGG